MAAPPTSPPALAGYVLKQTKAEWKSRYAILDRSVLSLFKHKRNSFPCNTILLAGCTVDATDDLPGCSFAISHPSRPPSKRMLLATSEPQVLSSWLDALDQHTHAAPPAPLSHAPPSPRQPVPLLYEIPPADNRDVPPAYRGLVESMVTTFLVDYAFNSPRWTLQTDHGGAKSTQLYHCDTTRAAAMSKLMLKQAAGDIATVVVDPTFDAAVRASTVLDTFNEHTTLQHITTKGMFPHRGRDFVVLTHRRTLPDQSVLVVSQSVPTPPANVTSHHADRANLRIEGYHIVPNADDTAAEVTYVVHVAGDENLPDHVVVSHALKLDVLRALLEPAVSPTSPRVHRALPRAFSEVSDPAFHSPRKVGTPATPPQDDVGEYAIPAQFAADVDRAIATLVDATTASGLASWSFHSESGGVRAYSKLDGSSLTSVLGTGAVAFPASTILGFLLDTGRKVAYDPMCAAAYPIARLDTHTALDYYASKPVLIVSGRDFVNVVHWRVLSDQSIVVVARATETDRMPPKAGLVRGEIHVAGWHIVPTSPASALVSFMVKMDLKGSIPTCVQNKVVVDQAYVILALRKQLEALPKMKSFRVKNESSKRSEAAPIAPLNAPIESADDSAPYPKDVIDKTTPEPTKKGSMVWIDDTPAAPVQTPVDTSMWTMGLYLAALSGAFYALPNLLGFNVLVWAVAVYLAVQLHLGPTTPAQRRGLLTSWKASLSPGAEPVQGSLVVDCSDTLAYLEQLERRSGKPDVTLTHVVARAVAHALRRTPSLHGRVAFGSFYPTSSGVDVSCLVDIQDGRDVDSVTVEDTDALSIQSIAAKVATGVGNARSGQSPTSLFWPRSRWAQAVPSSLVRFWVSLVEWTSHKIPSLGLKPHRFSHAIVANAGKLGFDDAVSVPKALISHVPLAVVIGAVSKRAVVVEGDDEDRVVVRPVVRLTVKIDPQYVEPAAVAQLTRHLRELVEHPGVLDVGVLAEL